MECRRVQRVGRRRVRVGWAGAGLASRRCQFWTGVRSQEPRDAVSDGMETHWDAWAWLVTRLDEPRVDRCLMHEASLNFFGWLRLRKMEVGDSQASSRIKQGSPQGGRASWNPPLPTRRPTTTRVPLCLCPSRLLMESRDQRYCLESEWQLCLNLSSERPPRAFHPSLDASYRILLL
jgi:hypothetical protein